MQIMIRNAELQCNTGTYNESYQQKKYIKNSWMTPHNDEEKKRSASILALFADKNGKVSYKGRSRIKTPRRSVIDFVNVSISEIGYDFVS